MNPKQNFANTTLSNNSWYSYNYNLPNNLISQDQIKISIDKFNNDVLNNLRRRRIRRRRLIIFRIKTEDNLFRNISTFQRINKDDKSKLVSIFTAPSAGVLKLITILMIKY